MLPDLLAVGLTEGTKKLLTILGVTTAVTATTVAIARRDDIVAYGKRLYSGKLPENATQLQVQEHTKLLAENLMKVEQENKAKAQEQAKVVELMVAQELAKLQAQEKARELMQDQQKLKASVDAQVAAIVAAKFKEQTSPAPVATVPQMSINDILKFIMSQIPPPTESHAAPPVDKKTAA